MLQDAEQRASAASDAAEEANAAAARLLGHRHAQAKGAAADAEAQAKATSLRALVSLPKARVGDQVWSARLALLPGGNKLNSMRSHVIGAQQLEKQLAAARQELGALRQQQALPAVQQQQRAAREEALQQQQQLQALRRQLATAQQQQASTQQQLQGKAAALAAAEKRLRQFEAALRRLASKQGSACDGTGSEDLIAAQYT